MTQEELTKIKAIARDIARQEIAKALAGFQPVLDIPTPPTPAIEQQEENYDEL